MKVSAESMGNAWIRLEESVNPYKTTKNTSIPKQLHLGIGLSNLFQTSQYDQLGLLLRFYLCCALRLRAEEVEAAGQDGLICIDGKLQRIRRCLSCNTLRGSIGNGQSQDSPIGLWYLDKLSASKDFFLQVVWFYPSYTRLCHFSRILQSCWN